MFSTSCRPISTVFGRSMAIWLSVTTAGVLALSSCFRLAFEGASVGRVAYVVFFDVALAFSLFALTFTLARRHGVRGWWSVLMLGCSLSTTAFIGTIAWLVEGLMPGPHLKSLAHTVTVHMPAGLLATMVTVLVAVVQRQQAAADNERNWHIQALRGQLSPHFMVNALQAVAVVEELSVRERYVESLCNVCRYLQAAETTVKLADEMAFVDDYVALTALRYGSGALRVETVGLEGEALRWRLPPVSVQALVENAIKHNVASVEAPLTVRVEIGNDAGRAWVRVSNSLRPRSDVHSSGHGLANLDQRYRLLGTSGIEVQRNDSSFYVVLPVVK